MVNNKNNMKSKNKLIKTVCPRCKGTGFARAYNREPIYSDIIKRKAIRLRGEGLTLRAIGKILGVKHPQSVSNLIKK